jgi:hypothetical protein
MSVIALSTACLEAMGTFWTLGCASSAQAPTAAATGSPSSMASVQSGGVPKALASNASVALDARVRQPSGTDAGSHVDGGSEAYAPISSPCVLHSGQANKHTHRIRLPDGSVGKESVHGSCSANAECIAKLGSDSVGDGSVRIECSGHSCTCRLEPLASQVEPITSTFELDAPCMTSGGATKLLVERCMSGMTVVSHP